MLILARHCGLFAIAVVSALAALTPGITTPADAQEPPELPSSSPSIGPSTATVVFKLHDGMAPGVTRGLLGRLGVRQETVLTRSGLIVVRTESEQAANALVDALRASGLVEFVGRDRLVQALEVPDDPDYPRQWHLQTSEGGINAEGAWDLAPAGANGVVVAVIDTGVAYETYSASGALVTKRFEPAPDLAGVPIVAPWNFVDSNAHANDDNGHGTHVASTIAQATGNGISGAGVGRGAALMPLKILDYSGNGTGANLVESIYYAVENGADVINLSLGFPGSGQPEPNGAVCGEIPGLHEALDYAYTNRVLVVAASGNDGASIVSCPAAHPTVVAVGATDLAGAVTWYSNRGDALDVTAPGGDPNADLDRDRVSDGILQQTYCFDWLTLFFSGAYSSFCSAYQSGTSMASPIVAGVAALILGVDPTLSPVQVRYLLESTARDRGTAGWDSSYGYGLVDAHAAIASLLLERPPDLQLQPYPAPTPYPRPAAPSSLTATVLSSGSISLTWTNNATNQAGFRIESAQGSDPFRQIGKTTATSYTARGLAPGTTYQFRVYAYDAQDIDSAPSSTAAATTFAIPTAPSNLVSTSATAWSVSLRWTDNASTETGFRVEKSTDGTTFVFAGLVPRDGQALTVGSLPPGTVHWFRVRATDGENFSDFSNVAMATTLPQPSAPSNLQVTQTTASSVSLSWTDNATSEQGFRLEKSLDGGQTFSVAVLAPADWTSSTVNFLQAGQAYAFRVRAYAGTWQSEPSNTVYTQTKSAPPTPTNLAAAPLSPSQISLTWTDNAPSGVGYRIEKSLDGTNFALTGSLLSNGSSYTVASLNADTTYWFRVRAADGSAYSAYSNIASARTLAAPLAPSGLVLKSATAASLAIGWIDNSSNEQGFRIEKSTDGGATFAMAGLVGANQTSFTLTNLAPATSYVVRVFAYSGPALSVPSPTLQASTVGPPAAPSNLVAVALSATTVQLTWVDNSGVETGYRIVRSTDGLTWTTLASLLSNTTAYTVRSLQPATNYYFRVHAMDGTVLSAPSNTANVITLDAPAAPTNLTASIGMTSSTVRLTWQDNSSYESGFRIERSLDGSNWAVLATISPNLTSWNIFGVASKTTYFYRILAYDGSVLSGYSNTASITTP